MSTLDPEKFSLQRHQRQDIYTPTNANMPNAPWSRLRRGVIVGLLVLLPMLSYRGYFVVKGRSIVGSGSLEISSTEQLNPANPPIPAVLQGSNGSALVPLEAHIMSKCPDARDCLSDLIVPAMERISDIVDFRLSFIGTYVTPVFPYSVLGILFPLFLNLLVEWTYFAPLPLDRA